MLVLVVVVVDGVVVNRATVNRGNVNGRIVDCERLYRELRIYKRRNREQIVVGGIVNGLWMKRLWMERVCTECLRIEGL